MSIKRNIRTLFAVCSAAILLIELASTARAEFGVSFSTALDTSTAIPSGTGNFTYFPTAPGISNGSISFVGLVLGDQIGFLGIRARWLSGNRLAGIAETEKSDIVSADAGASGN
jgi:hypothetical protein